MNISINGRYAQSGPTAKYRTYWRELPHRLDPALHTFPSHPIFATSLLKPHAVIAPHAAVAPPSSKGYEANVQTYETTLETYRRNKESVLESVMPDVTLHLPGLVQPRSPSQNQYYPKCGTLFLTHALLAQWTHTEIFSDALN